MKLESWVEVPEPSDFPIENLPFGVFTRDGEERSRVGVAIGDHILDLAQIHRAGVIRLPNDDMVHDSLNALMAFGLGTVRRRASELLTLGNEELASLPNRGLVDRLSVEMLLPFTVGDFIDFYSSEHHASNVGRMFRPDDPPLLPNWKHLPIGYHGRSGTVVVSGTDISRPTGQRRGESGPMYGPSTRMDFELEVGFVVGSFGKAIKPDEAELHLAGLVLVNDWSARDIQAWEYQPLGPFLGKSFATTISPWLVTMEALAPYRIPGPIQDPLPLPYLRGSAHHGFDVTLEVSINGHDVSTSSLSNSYWTAAQQLTHSTSNGATTRPGDLFATGTLSGSEPDSLGSLLELSWNGTTPIEVGSEKRTFLEDGDEVAFRGYAQREGRPRIGFGECTGRIVAGEDGI